MTADFILHLIKSRGPQTAQAIARQAGISPVAARKRLAALQTDGLVAYDESRAGVGRPRRHWRLTACGHARFPDTHDQLTVELIDGVRRLFGEAGLERLIAEREQTSRQTYARELAGYRSLRGKLRRLAELRSEEGYMAECRRDGDGWLLVENHCPICAAATACQGFCRAELAAFRAALGDGVTVERVEHIPAGARRCAYRIRHG